jgi:hypothetical protein
VTFRSSVTIQRLALFENEVTQGISEGDAALQSEGSEINVELSQGATVPFWHMND